MNRKILYSLWGCLFILCAGLGFIPEPAGAVRLILRLLSLLHFAVPALLLYFAVKARDSWVIRLIGYLSAASLVLSVLLMVLNIVFATGSETVGTFLHVLLVIVSAPMFCSGMGAVSLFFWACLLLTSVRFSRKPQ